MPHTRKARARRCRALRARRGGAHTWNHHTLDRFGVHFGAHLWLRWLRSCERDVKVNDGHTNAKKGAGVKKNKNFAPPRAIKIAAMPAEARARGKLFRVYRLTDRHQPVIISVIICPFEKS